MDNRPYPKNSFALFPSSIKLYLKVFLQNSQIHRPGCFKMYNKNDIISFWFKLRVSTFCRVYLLMESKNIQDCSRRMRTPVGADHNKESQGRTEKYAGVGGSTQLDFINIKISSNRVMGYVHICIHTVKVRINIICICNHFPPSPI